MKNRQLKIGLLIITCCCFALRSAAQNNIILNLKDGTGKDFTIGAVKKITFTAGNMVVSKTDATSDNFLLSDIQKITFGAFSGVNEITAGNTGLELFPNPATDFIQIKNTGDVENLDVQIYSTDGILIAAFKLRPGTDLIPVSRLGKGIYLLKARNQILKFIKQ